MAGGVTRLDRVEVRVGHELVELTWRDGMAIRKRLPTENLFALLTEFADAGASRRVQVDPTYRQGLLRVVDGLVAEQPSAGLRMLRDALADALAAAAREC